MIVTLLGLDHELQRKDITSDLRRLVAGLLDQASVDLIAGEVKEGEPTVVRQVAQLFEDPGENLWYEFRHKTPLPFSGR